MQIGRRQWCQHTVIVAIHGSVWTAGIGIKLRRRGTPTARVTVTPIYLLYWSENVAVERHLAATATDGRLGGSRL